MAKITFGSDSGGSHYDVTIEWPGKEPAMVTLVETKPGQPAGPPLTHRLTNLKARADGSEIQCTADGLSRSGVTTREANAPGGAAITVYYYVFWQRNENAFPVTAADLEHLKGFVKACGFPSI